MVPSSAERFPVACRYHFTHPTPAEGRAGHFHVLANKNKGHRTHSRTLTSLCGCALSLHLDKYLGEEVTMDGARVCVVRNSHAASQSGRDHARSQQLCTGVLVALHPRPVLASVCSGFSHDDGWILNLVTLV